MNETKISKRRAFTLGILLFSMFFGSGNLIFPPYLGFEAGSKTWLALIGFTATAVVFPVLGVIAISENGDLMKLAGKVNKKFALFFSIVVFLALGPGLAIPRNAAVSFEMAVVPFVPSVSLRLRIGYSIVFFLISFLLSVHPEKLADWLGRILGPVMLVLMLVIVLACFLNAPGGFALPKDSYADNQLIQGFMDGYNTMDTLAALNFGSIIALNVMSQGIREKKTVVRYTMHAGIIAGIILFAVYAALAFAGALSGGMFPDAANGASVLTNIVFYLFGKGGVVLLGVIYVLSCLTTCVGLLCSCAEYFAGISRVKYIVWVTVFAIGGCAFSIVGLNQLLAISIPFLTAVYPVAMVLVILGLIDKKHEYKMIYPCSIGMTGFVSIIYALNTAGISIPYLTDFLLSLPPSKDLCWLIPACIGVLAGMMQSRKNQMPQLSQSEEAESRP